MPKHNNIIPNAHFRKDWQRRVKTWFDQASRKKRRRVARQLKAKLVAPRPVAGALRPIVHPQTNKYNFKTRLGRGFTFDELKEAGINKKLATTIGICVDHRRKNRSTESLQANVQRLKEYKAKLVLIPRNTKKPKKGDASADEVSKASQLKAATIMPIVRKSVKAETRKIKAEEKAVKVYEKLRRARSDARLVGIRKKRAEAKAKEEEEKKK
eukprot:tig00020629_g12358.t1